MTVEPHLTVFDGLKGLEKEGDTSVIGEVYKRYRQRGVLRGGKRITRTLYGGDLKWK